jgi:3-hydroxy acid dehydrogenase / malonic semialdehyde reductase
MNIALITGVTGGIGKAIAQELIKHDYKLVVVGRNQSKLTTIVEELGSTNFLYTDSFDLKDRQRLKTFVDKVNELGHQIDVLINNAGAALGLDPFMEAEVADLTDMIDVNVTSLMVLSHYIAKTMVKNNKGHIINIGSTAGQMAYLNGMAYCASKAAVKTLSDGMRLDLMQSDVKVTTIMPGLVETEFSKVRFKGDEVKAKQVYEGIEALQPEDVAHAVWYVLDQPPRVQIQELSLLATHQGNGFTAYKKK